MARIPQHIVDEIFSRIDLLEIVSSKVELKKQGKSWKGKSPFGTDKTPSFYVFNKNGFFWKDFSSGKGGDAIKFLQETEGWNYRECLEFLAQKYGIEIPSEDTDSGIDQEQANLRAILNWHLDRFLSHKSQNISNESPFSRFIKDRGIEPALEKWELGFAIESWNDQYQAALAQGYTYDQLEQAGMLIAKGDKNYDRFRNRVIFPIRDLYGRICGFGGRALDKKDKAKYLNSPDSLIYHKGKILYGLHLAKNPIRALDYAILTEGYMDTISMHQAGFENAVATCGTALTQDQVNLLKRFCSTIFILRDGDSAGIRATIKDIEICTASGLNTNVLTLPEGQDPDSYIREFGAEAMKVLLSKNFVNGIGFLLDHHSKGLDTKQVQTQKKLIETIKPVLLSMPLEYERELYVQLVASRLDVAVSAVEKAVGILPTAQAAFQDMGYRLYSDYQTTYEQLGFDLNPDFSVGSEEIEVEYFSIDGSPQTKAKGKKTYQLKRAIGEVRLMGGRQLESVYIPPSLRELAQEEDKENSEIHKGIQRGAIPLLIVQDELVADMICRTGLPAVGMSFSQAWLAKGRKIEMTPELRKTISILGFKRLILMAHGDSLQLNTADPENQPIDIHHRRFYQTLDLFEKATRDFQTWVITPNTSRIHQKNLNEWIEDLIKEDKAGFAFDIKNIFNPKAKSNKFRFHEITSASKNVLQEVARIRYPQNFYDIYAKALPRKFRMGTKLFEVRANNQVEEILDLDPAPQVWEQHGTLWARQRDGSKKISNFGISCILEIKAKRSLGVYKLTKPEGIEAWLAITDKNFSGLDSFLESIRRLPGKFFFTGTKQNLLDMWEDTNREAEECISLDYHLGIYKPPRSINSEPEDSFYVWGDGLTDETGRFHRVDEYGVVQLEKKKYFLPAWSTLNLSGKNPEKEFKQQRRFSCEIPFQESEKITLPAYLEQFLKVHGQNGHIGFLFILAALCFDIFKEQSDSFPVAFLKGIPNSGKGTLAKSMGAFFGGADMLNLEKSNTMASINAHVSQAASALAFFNEFNYSNITGSFPAFIKYIKAAWDMEGRKRIRDIETNQTEEVEMASMMVLLGQEDVPEKSVMQRVIIAEFLTNTYTAEQNENYLSLRAIEAKGITHLTNNLIGNRKLIRERLKPAMSWANAQLKEKVSFMADQRFFSNWSSLLAPMFILLKENKIDYPLTISQLIDFAAGQIEKQVKSMKEDGLAAIFFEFLMQEFSAVHPRLNDTTVFISGTELRVQFMAVYEHFAAYLQRTGKIKSLENTQRKYLKEDLINHVAFIREEKKNCTVGYKRTPEGYIKRSADGKPVPRKTSALIFNYTELQARGLEIQQPDFEEDTDDNSAVPFPQAIAS
ncbi:MAG: DNA primase [Bacteroidota bacterium]